MIQPPKGKMFITPNDLRKRYGSFDPNIFRRWQQAGKVEKLRNGLYLQQEEERFAEVDLYPVSYHIYGPSYISLHTALHYHGLIPEYVFDITAIATRKTANFRHFNTRFTYRQVQEDLFFGYELIPWKNSVYAIATPEKALLDLAYLEPLFSDPNWLEEMRFDEQEIRETLDWDYMMIYASSMPRIVEKRIGLLLHVYDI